MTNAETIIAFLKSSSSDYCDDCLSRESGVSPRQQVYQICERLAGQGSVRRSLGRCSACGRSKTVNQLAEYRPSTEPQPLSSALAGATVAAGTDGAEGRMLTEPEMAKSQEVVGRLEQVRSMLSSARFPPAEDFRKWHDLLVELRRLQGNVSNDLAFFATLMAKQFLKRRHGIEFDAAAKAQGAPGLDIDSGTENGKRVVAEIKTTVPYLGTDFGTQQSTSIKRDIVKLVSVLADYKYLFVTDASAFDVLKAKRYLASAVGVRLVLLTTGEEYAG